MSRAIRTTFGKDNYVSDEWDARLSIVRGWRGDLPFAVWCHGNNQGAASDLANYGAQLRIFADSFHVVTADLGGSTFGNDTGVTRVGQLLDYLGAATTYLIGVSMGGAVALNYAVRHPERVIAIAGIIPALTLNVDDANPAANEIDAAYSPTYDPGNVAHLAHDPTAFASDLPEDMPIHLWTSSNDPTCLPAYTTAFLAERPQTEHTSHGTYGHGGIAVAAPLAYEWLRSLE